MTHAVRATSDPSTSARYNGFEKMLLDGKWRDGRSGQVSEDRDPYTNEVLVRITLADQQDLDEAFRAAATAQPEWQMMLASERAAIIRRAPGIIDERRECMSDHP